MTPTPEMQKKSKMTILLSVNAAAIVIAGILIASAIWFNGGATFHVVGERSDIVKDEMGELELLESVSESEVAPIAYQGDMGGYTYTTQNDTGNVPDGEIWNETTLTIYATPDIDICVGNGLTNLGDMYWQTSNASVISGFYDSARTWLGYDKETCRYPVVSGIGTTTITAGTYDGKRKDSITVNVVAPPVEQWKKEVLSFVNNIRANNNLSALSWGNTCESAADTRAHEIINTYSHTRPDGTSWSTACPAPENGGTSGENLAIGNAAVSPVTTVMLWMGSDSHRANILNPDFTKLAVGFVFDLDSTYKTHWSQFFSTY
ncbi:CAP domain-containing protein [Candidatus Saccharibacteria bacterium]|nr:CAP domain-containing protein [Candidatus Saccharibacteria bacterium]MBR3332589.1 CAP domain-containing protein [Candidatus Saccharibacteria bacterium]